MHLFDSIAYAICILTSLAILYVSVKHRILPDLFDSLFLISVAAMIANSLTGGSPVALAVLLAANLGLVVLFIYRLGRFVYGEIKYRLYVRKFRRRWYGL